MKFIQERIVNIGDLEEKTAHAFCVAQLALHEAEKERPSMERMKGLLGNLCSELKVLKDFNFAIEQRCVSTVDS